MILIILIFIVNEKFKALVLIQNFRLMLSVTTTCVLSQVIFQVISEYLYFFRVIFQVPG